MVTKAKKNTKKKSPKPLTEFQSKLFAALKARTADSLKKPSVKKALKEADGVRKQIQKLRDELEGKKKAEEKKSLKSKSEKAKRAQKLIDSGKFGCQTQVVAKTLSILLDEEIEPSFKEYTYKDFEIESEQEIESLIMNLDSNLDQLVSGTVVVCENHPENPNCRGTYMVVQSWNNCDGYEASLPTLVDPKEEGGTDIEEHSNLYVYRPATEEEIEAFVRKTNKNFGKDKFIFA